MKKNKQVPNSNKIKIAQLISGQDDVWLTMDETKLLLALPELEYRNYSKDAPFAIYAHKHKLFILDSQGMDIDSRNICDENDIIWEKLYQSMAARIKAPF